MICDSCRTNSPLTAIQARTDYNDVAKQLVHHLKFERAVAAAKPMAHAMAELLPQVSHSSSQKGLVQYHQRKICIAPVPTATSRIRMRGYDQAAVLARLIARHNNLPYRPLLVRTTQARQVGATRQQRRTQLKDAFHVRRSTLERDLTVILVDDVLTTGSSLEAAAAALRAAGVARIFGLVFARQQ